MHARYLYLKYALPAGLISGHIVLYLYIVVNVNGNELIVFPCFQGGGIFWQPDRPSQYHGKLAELHGHFLTAK